jgi:hypothetical protein
MRRATCLFLVATLGLVACSKRTPPTQTTETQTLAPSDSVDPAFEGCSKSCGSRSAKDRASARPQPGVEPGETTFCPVSGAVFMVKQESPHFDVTVRGESKKLYFCCEACAKWFQEHRDEVLSKRGLAPV